MQNTYFKNKSKVKEILQKAMNDWSTDVVSYKGYYDVLVSFIGNDITKKTILEKLETISFKKYSWEAESLFQLCEIYDFFNADIDLKIILQKIEESSHDELNISS